MSYSIGDIVRAFRISDGTTTMQLLQPVRAVVCGEIASDGGEIYELQPMGSAQEWARIPMRSAKRVYAERSALIPAGSARGDGMYCELMRSWGTAQRRADIQDAISGHRQQEGQK